MAGVNTAPGRPTSASSPRSTGYGPGRESSATTAFGARAFPPITLAMAREPIGAGPSRPVATPREVVHPQEPRAGAATLRPVCGIVGYVGWRGAQEVLVNGLRRLEYRGYDSAGVSVVDGTGSLEVHRAAGPLDNLVAVLPEGGASDEPTGRGGTTGMGHTRWATHGPPTDRNAHPHRDATGKVAVVHNGIIENFAALRAELEAEGVELASDTDTEVAAHLVARAYDGRPGRGDCTGAVRAVVARLEGAFTLVVHPRRPARRDRRRPALLAAGGRRRRGRDVRGLRRRRVHRAHPRGGRARPGPGRHDHPRRLRSSPTSTATPPRPARSTSTGTSPPPRRAATTTSC